MGGAAEEEGNAGELEIASFSLELCLHTDELLYSTVIPSNLPLRSPNRIDLTRNESCW